MYKAYNTRLYIYWVLWAIIVLLSYIITLGIHYFDVLLGKRNCTGNKLVAAP